MRKKLPIIIGAFAIILGLGAGFTAYASYSTSTQNLLKSVDILGISVVRSASMKFSLLDITNASTQNDFFLPSVDGNNGMVYMIRVVDREFEGNTINVYPATGEKIDGATNDFIYMGDDEMKSEWVMLIADEANDTWWVAAHGHIGVDI